MEIRNKFDQSCKTTEVGLAKSSCYSDWRNNSIESDEDDQSHNNISWKNQNMKNMKNLNMILRLSTIYIKITY